MFELSDLETTYHYDYSLGKSILKVLFTNTLNKQDPFQMVALINFFLKSGKWDYTYYNCKKAEYLIQKKLPQTITRSRDVYIWLTNNWNKFNVTIVNDNFSAN